MNVQKRRKLLLLLEIYHALKNRKSYSFRRRIYQVHPLYRARKLHGEYFTLFQFLEKYQIEEFYFILNEIQDDIAPKNNLFRKTMDFISLKEKLCLTLRFLATRASFADFAFRFLMGKTTVRNCIIQTIAAINNRLKKIYMPMCQNPKEWQNIADGFLKTWNFPNCLGAVDGKHIRMFAPRNSGSFNVNYKKCFSTILMALVDANYRFVMVSIGAHGSNSDSTVFSPCYFGNHWINNPVKLKVIADTPLTDTTEPQPYVLVGDEAFGLRYNMLTPYPGTSLSQK